MATIEILGVPHAYGLTAPTQSPHTLVFIHGWLLSRGYWQPLTERLAPFYQCLDYDLRGFGQSQPDVTNQLVDRTCLSQKLEAINTKVLSATARYTPAAYAQDLAILLQQLNITSAWLIGHSLGGSIALWAAEQMPKCVKGVICINAGGGVYLKEAFEQFRSSGQQLLKIRPPWLCQVPLIDLLFARANVARPIARAWGRQRLIDFVVAPSGCCCGSVARVNNRGGN